MLVRPDQHGALATVDVWGVQPQDSPMRMPVTASRAMM